MLADALPARGAPIADLLAATVVGAIGFSVAMIVAVLYYRGGARPVRWSVTKGVDVSGLPAWAALPSAVIGLSLLTAVLGFYWDVATHIDNGRDAGPFANAAHYPILFGLIGIALGGALSILVAISDDEEPGFTARLMNAPRGSWLVLHREPSQGSSLSL